METARFEDNYDSFGNLLVQDNNLNPAPTYTIDQATNRLNRMDTVHNTPLYGYDAAGNLTSSDLSMGVAQSSINGHNFTYNAQSQIATVDSGTSASYTYIYNGMGERSNKTATSGQTDYVYLNGQPMSEVALSGGTGTWSDYVYAGGQKIARAVTSIYGGITTAHYYLDDHLGTTQVELDALGNVTWQGQFTPFGQELPGTTTTDMHYKFTGKERDAESGLDYFGARYYASSMGRFSSPDNGEDQDMQDPQSWNLYPYVRNNPITNTDPDGRDCVVQSRVDDNHETVSVTSGDCKGKGTGSGERATYVSGHVDGYSANGGNSLDIGSTNADGARLLPMQKERQRLTILGSMALQMQRSSGESATTSIAESKSL